MLNEEYLHYTYMHRKAFAFTVNKIVKDEFDRQELLLRAKFHDVDKMLLYTLIPKGLATEYHRDNSHHHLGNGIAKDVYDRMEAIIDFECAGYTKPDKPLNAYDTIKQNAVPDRGALLDIMRIWNIAYSYENTPDNVDWLEYAQTIDEPTEKHYLYEIHQWIIHDPYTASKALQYAEMVHLNHARHNGYPINFS